MTIANKAAIRGYVGPKGSGKSHLALEQSKKEKRLVRLELAGDKAFEAGAVVVHTKLEFIRALKPWDGWRKKQHICFHVGRGQDLTSVLDFVCAGIIAAGGGALLIDECQRFLPPNVRAPVNVTTIIHEGRKVKTPVYWTTLLPRQMNFELREQADSLALFNAYGSLYSGFYKDYADKDLINQLHEAPKYSYIWHESGKRPELKKP